MNTTTRTRVSGWALVIKICGGVLIGVACFAVAYKFVSQYRRYREACRQRDSADGEIRRKHLAIKEVRTDIRKIETDPAFVERVAREDGRAAPGETVVKFTNSVPETAGPQMSWRTP